MTEVKVDGYLPRILSHFGADPAPGINESRGLLSFTCLEQSPCTFIILWRLLSGLLLQHCFFEAAERASRFTEADLKTHADITAAGFWLSRDIDVFLRGEDVVSVTHASGTVWHERLSRAETFTLSKRAVLTEPACLYLFTSIPSHRSPRQNVQLTKLMVAKKERKFAAKSLFLFSTSTPWQAAGKLVGAARIWHGWDGFSAPQLKHFVGSH